MLGDNIRRIRNIQQLSLNALAKKAGVSSGYLSELENNISKNPTMDKLNKIAEALGVSVDEFFKEDGKDVEPTSNPTVALHRDDGYDNDLPAEARKELKDYIEFLKHKYGKKGE